MNSRRNSRFLILIFVMVVILGGVWLFKSGFWQSPSPAAAPTAAPSTPAPSTPIPSTPAPSAPAPAPAQKPLSELVEKYRDLKISDSHNHDASRNKYVSMMPEWKANGIERVVLFGDVSTQSAVQTDINAWKAYEDYPEMIVPYFAGIDLNDKASLKVVRENLEKGYFGIGEVAAASTFSPILANAPWKTLHPMDGYLPKIYEIAGQYKVPVLLHIDPPYGTVIEKLEEALEAYPDTLFIFAHINVHTTPQHVESLMEKHKNLYADFFAGFTVSETDERKQLDDFIPVLKEFPDRFMLSTDSGVGVESEEAAIDAMYRVVDLLDDPVIAKKIAYENLDAIIQAQPATKTQKKLLQKIAKKTGRKIDIAHVSKYEAGRIIIENR